MDVVFLVYNADNKGAVMSSTRRQAEYLAEQGHGVTLISNQATSWSGVKTLTVETPQSRSRRMLDYFANVVSNRLPRMLQSIDCRTIIPFAGIGAAALKEIAKLIRQKTCDRIVICQHPCIFGLQSVRSLVPIVLVAHGDIFSHPWNAFSLPLTMMYRRAARRAYRESDGVISVSSALADRAISLGANARSVHVIPNGIDPSEIGWHTSMNASSTASVGRPLKLFSVGRLAPEKAVDVLLQAFALLPRGEFILDIVGDGQQKADLIALSRKLNLEPFVIFHGSKPRSELGSFYRDADLVCLPSLSEAQPVVTLEALVAGKPMVASRVGGVPDSVKDGFNGRLVKPNDPRELAEAVLELANNPAIREQMGLNARLRLEEFSWSKILKRFESALETAKASHQN